MPVSGAKRIAVEAKAGVSLLTDSCQGSKTPKKKKKKRKRC